MKRYRIVPAIIFMLLTACNRTIPCINQYITPAFIGYSPSDLDTVVVRQYQRDGSFLQLVDTTVVVTDTARLRYYTSNDTTFLLLNNIIGREKFLFPDHDWRIFIPVRNTTFSFSGFDSPQTETSCFKCQCWNPVNSLLLNGVFTVPDRKQVPAFGGQYYLMVYLR